MTPPLQAVVCRSWNQTRAAGSIRRRYRRHFRIGPLRRRHGRRNSHSWLPKSAQQSHAHLVRTRPGGLDPLGPV